MLCDPSGGACDTYWHAARAWTLLCQAKGDAQLWKSLQAAEPLAEGVEVTLAGLSRE